jgi:hypothetical protein
MALSDKTNQLVTKYTRRQYPELEDGVRRYIQDELQRIEQSISTIGEASIQVAETPPTNPVRGMVRFATTGWEPLGNGTTNFLVVYNGTAWVAV